MNDKPGGTPSPFSFAPQPGPTPNPNPSPAPSPFSPSNFGSKPAPAPAAPPKPRPMPSPADLGASAGTSAASAASSAKPATPTPVATAPGPAELRPTSPATPKVAAKPSTPAATPAATAPTTASAPTTPTPSTASAAVPNAAKPTTSTTAPTGAASSASDTKTDTTASSSAKAAPAPDNPFNPTVSSKPNPFLNLTTNSASAGSSASPRTTVTTETPKSLDPYAPNIAKETELEPANRPLLKSTPITLQPEQPPKKKTGVIIGAVATFALLLIGVVAGVFFLKFNQKDPVAAAIEKLLSGGAPSNIQVAGTITGSDTSGTSLIGDGNCSIGLNATVNVSSLMNQADLNISCDNVPGTTLEVSEISTTKDTFIKLAGLSDFLEGMLYSDEYVPETIDDVDIYEDDEIDEDDNAEEEDNTVPVTSGEEDFMDSFSDFVLQLFAMIFGQVDSEWIKLDNSSMDLIDVDAFLPTNSSCSGELVSSLRGNFNLVSEFYQKAPFITSTTEGVTLAQKNSQVYKVVIDSKKYRAFIESLDRQGVFEDYSACVAEHTMVDNCIDDVTGLPTNCITVYDGDEEDEKITNDNGTVSASPLDSIYNLPSTLPTLYVEVDNNYNFTRIYLTSRTDELSYTADFALTYPETVNITDPEDYLTMDELFDESLIQAFLMGGFDDEGNDTDTDQDTNSGTQNPATGNNANSTGGNNNGDTIDDDDELIFFDDDESFSVTPNATEFVSGTTPGENARSSSQVNVSN